MDKDKKNRSGSQSGNGSKQNASDGRRTEQPGAPNKSNRQTGGSKRHERDDSNGGPDKNTTKKGENSI